MLLWYWSRVRFLLFLETFVLKQRLASFQHLHTFSRQELSFFLILRSPSCTKKIMYQCVSFWVLHPTGPSKISPWNCHFEFQCSFGFSQIHPCIWISRESPTNLTFLSPQRRTPHLSRSALSSSEVCGTRFHSKGSQSARPIPSCFFSPHTLSTKTVMFVNVFLSSESYCSSGFTDHIPCCTLQWNKVEFSRFTHHFGLNVSALFPQSWSKQESLMHADLYRVPFSFNRIGLFLPSNTTLSCNVPRGVCTHCLGVLVASRFFDDEGCVSPTCMSKNSPVWSVPTLNTTVQQQKTLCIRIFESKCVPCLSL